MAIIYSVEFAWSPVVTLSTDEIWQSRGDTIYVSTNPNPAENDGIALRRMEAIRFSAGTQIRYRRVGTEPVQIAREAIF
jgi:hypothetical protein